MIHTGEYASLTVTRFTDFGTFLTTTSGEEVLLPRAETPESLAENDTLRVFLYCDSEDRPTATLRTPALRLHTFAPLTVTDVNAMGAFCDWGLTKELLIPYFQMFSPLKKDETAVVYLCRDDDTGRLYGTTRLGPHLQQPAESDLATPADVSAMVYHISPHGALAVVNGQWSGMFPPQESSLLTVGTSYTATVKVVQDDGKIDLTFAPASAGQRDELEQQILAALQAAPGGVLPYHDKSDAASIQNAFSMSKKTFKKTVGSLYKKGRIRIKKGHHISLP
ncbi:CvfB family protein [Chitinivibrio alkaliphilus]|uniref:RNA-binding S1 domain-containing protein n=1 Tax=Chitinivibrio alkaliphilus ACht1 TaxID=1313304 RepID=U7DC25_9BACT|nr:S1-like domain-containing RNA-binding protein [Chitinivibrio alkaliphilus]ERP39133.1 RNA-binding S1 domain-containing protein [Chitinivibrio alkaliphilus ACht1]